MMSVFEYYSSKVYVGDGNVEFLLYTNSANQYEWLLEYEGQTVQMEIAARVICASR